MKQLVNRKPVSILPLLSEVNHRLICNQLFESSESILNSILFGFREVHSTQHALFKILQSWPGELDNQGFVAVLIDFSWAAHC